MELEPFQALPSPSSYQQVTVSRTHLLTLSTGLEYFLFPWIYYDVLTCIHVIIYLYSERQVTMHLMPEGLAIDLPDLMTTSSEHDQLQGKDIIE